MNIVKSTQAYEAWIRTQLEIVPADLKQKHALMASDVFPFMRSTFYRWSQLWPEVCAELKDAPETLAVGDLHVENFGTWRDQEARLVWGINDFDEVAKMPFAIDLVRLAASAHFAIKAGHLNLEHKDACLAIADGYKTALEAGGMPWVLGEKHVWLSQLVDLRDPVAFWAKLDLLKDYVGKVPKEALRGIDQLMPGKNPQMRIAHRVAGLGSLGRQRFVAIAGFEGARVCREAKALAPSAWLWAMGQLKKGRQQTNGIRYQDALDTSVRAVDPFVHFRDNWFVRRLAPDCTRVELAAVPKDKDKSKLLHAMGFETANLHIGAGATKPILKYLTKLDKHWLHTAATNMVKATTADWEEWRAHMGEGSQTKATEGKSSPAKSKAKVKKAGA
jgi:hypothetical protein